MLEINEIRNSVLVGGVREHEIIFIDLEKLNSAVEAINRFEAESNEFIRDSILPAKKKAELYIKEWKKIHTSKVNEVIEKKEAEHKAKLERIAKAKKLLPKLDKTFKDFESIVNEIQGIEKDILQSLFYGGGNPHNKDFDDVFKDIKECIQKSIKG